MLNGLCVIGCFPFCGELLKQVTPYNVLQIGLILSMFGIGGIIAGRCVASIRQKIGNWLCLLAGAIGAVSIFCSPLPLTLSY